MAPAQTQRLSIGPRLFSAVRTAHRQHPPQPRAARAGVAPIKFPAQWGPSRVAQDRAGPAGWRAKIARSKTETIRRAKATQSCASSPTEAHANQRLADDGILRQLG